MIVQETNPTYLKAEEKFSLNFEKSELEWLLNFLENADNQGFKSKLIEQCLENQYPIETHFKPINYKDFKSLEILEETFNINIFVEDLFSQVEPLEISLWLRKELKDAQEMGFISEKERSELIIMPVLKELRRRNDNQFRIYSGRTLNADEERGLKGECDFMLSLEKDSKYLKPPIFNLLEAKKDNIEAGLIQCAAQMIGAKIYNEKKENALITIYGGVTTGREWQFLKLENQRLTLDTQVYYLNEINKILGILQTIVNHYLPPKSES